MCNLITNIWVVEELPKDWGTGTRILVYKKGDHCNCSNYRGISLVHTLLKNILLKKI